MVRSIQVLRLVAIGSIYLSLGTGVFAGCGDPALQSTKSEVPAAAGSGSLGGQQAATLAAPSGQTQRNAGQEAARGPGLRHSTNDTEHVVLRAAPDEGSTVPESVALCGEKDYAQERASGQVGAPDGDRSSGCRTP